MRICIKEMIRIRSVRFALGILLAVAACFTSVIVYHNLKAGLFFAVLFIATGIVKIPETMISHRHLLLIYFIWLACTAFVTLLLSQLCLNESLPESAYAKTLGILLIFTCFLLPLFFTLRIRSTSIIISAVLILFSCVNYFVSLYRGNEIMPGDLPSIGTAANVMSEYSFHIPAAMFYALTMCLVYYYAFYALPPLRIDRKRLARAVGFVLALVCAGVLWFGGLRLKPLLWMKNGSVFNGFFLNFALSLRESFPQKPGGYNSDDVDTIAKEIVLYGGESEQAKPDIIVIMDESFADIDVLGGKLNTDIDVTPFVDNLRKNTLRGYALSSIFGGGTPNSEYEFLTGNTFLFLPTGSIAYQQFIKESEYSVARELKHRGYTTIAMHQNNPECWRREAIWPLLGFDDCLFKDDFPQKELLRNYGTDQEMFETLTSVYEQRRAASESPMFIFGVTIQNHGGYDYSESDFTPTVHLKGYSRSYPDVEQYLTCIHESDKAVQWLIEYFEHVDREVVVLFFGDHLPKLDDDFCEELHGGPFKTLDEQMLRYKVPFFIWTNYESKSEEMEDVSLNYLAGLLFQRAGMEMPPYLEYLSQLRQEIPACNAFGYYSKDAGRYLKLEEAQSKEKDELLTYNWLVWNCMFDKSGKNNILFPS